MYENEAVDESEAKEFANEHNAIFQKTSAKDSSGIDLLFVKLAKKFFNPSNDVNGIEQKDISGKTGDQNDYIPNIKLDGKDGGNTTKKKCC